MQENDGAGVVERGLDERGVRARPASAARQRRGAQPGEGAHSENPRESEEAHDGAIMPFMER